MMRKSRMLLVSAIALALIAAVAAPAMVSAEEIVLRVGMQDWGDAFGRTVLEEELVPKFEAANPGVKVEIIWIDWGSYGSRYKVLHAGNMLPDIVSIGSAGLGEFVELGMLQPLDEFVADWEGLSDMPPPAIDDGMVDGKLYSIAYRLDVRTLVYNERMFAEAGLAVAPPEDWDELLEYARRLVRRDGEGTIVREGFDVRQDIQHVLPFIFQNGGRLVSADGKRALLNERPVVEAVEFLHSLIYEHGVAVPAGNSFVRNNVAMMYDGSWLMVGGLNPILDDTGIALPPRKVEQTTQVHINKFAIGSSSKHPEIAWKWIAFFMEPENLARISMDSPRLTPRISSLEYAPFNEDHRWHTWMTTAALSTALPGYVPELSQILNETNKALQDIFQNRAPAQARLDELVRYIEASIMND